MNPTLLAQIFHAVRGHTLALASPLTAEDCCVQSMPDASPTKWHLGHTSWFFETFVLERWEAGFKPFDPVFRVLFNSYYNAVGDKHPRPQRGLLTRPGLDVVLAYRASVDQRLQALWMSPSVDEELLRLVELGVHHEQQHQELLLTDICICSLAARCCRLTANKRALTSSLKQWPGNSLPVAWWTSATAAKAFVSTMKRHATACSLNLTAWHHDW